MPKVGAKEYTHEGLICMESLEITWLQAALPRRAVAMTRLHALLWGRFEGNNGRKQKESEEVPPE